MKRVINKEYEKYILDCLKNKEEALPPDEWFNKKFRSRGE